jgi:signal peptidase I
MKWNEDNYGPIVVPMRGTEIKITNDNLYSWRKFILSDNDIENENDFKDSLTRIINNGIYIVKQDYVFIMGDNRDNSLDSRYIGFIKLSDVIGNVRLIYYSVDDKQHITGDKIGMIVE